MDRCEKQTASHSIQRLSKLMNELDQRNNAYIYATLNGLFFWEIRQIIRIEGWKEQYASELPRWLTAYCPHGCSVFTGHIRLIIIRIIPTLLPPPALSVSVPHLWDIH